ncbi:MAG: hypothetical protein RMY16_25150 [Nostoc sp. DedQUE12b]|uniref:hypothetical protein n=1 Tax=Nostoc sp. DedQUE12b TaxID=3075398 RepID=UPI002AD48AFB|nr:hypothetical protein [Nostoc sp. DedQUE12b]MDZ8088808.1 hypothetical protein [Nostoc sp. DedQUE12b]
MPSDFCKSINCFSLGCIFFIFIAFTVFFEQDKVTTFTCERKTQIHCQLTHANEWKSSVETYSLEEFRGAKFYFNHGIDNYCVVLLTNYGKLPYTFYYPFQSEAQEIVDKINTFIINPQEELVTVTQDRSISLNIAAAICFIFSVFGLGLTLYSYISTLP